MGFLRRLLRSARQVMARAAERLVVSGAQPDSPGPAPLETELPTDLDSPPEHWLQAVRAKAPWLLAAKWAGHRRAPVLMMTPEQTPSEVAPETQSAPRSNVVYKERKDRNATANPVTLSPQEPDRTPLFGSQPESDVASRPPVATVSASRSSHRPVSSHQDTEARRRVVARPTCPESPGPAGRGSVLEPGPTPSAPNRHALPEVRPVLICAPAETESPAAQDTSRPPKEDPPRKHPAAAESASIIRPERQLAAAPGEELRPSARFLPPVWSDPTGEQRGRWVDGGESSKESTDDRWPELPDWGWQQWQMDPIQRQFREWNRKVRLAAEQAGSSWSGPLF